MKPKQICFIVLLLIFSTLVLTINAQRKYKKILKKRFQPQTISLGVLNGKALDLVKPEYPPSAKYVGVKGLVSILVLIDEEGIVQSATAQKGHPLLIPNSLNAALKSTFQPVTLSHKKVKVSGIITYNYFLDSMNWLEIGFHFDSQKDIYRSLPTEFEEEKLLLIQNENLGKSDREQTLNSVKSMIESKLSTNEKSLWLFSVGQTFKGLFLNQWDAKQKDLYVEKLQNLKLNAPKTVSPVLTEKIEKFNYPLNLDEFNTFLVNFVENLNSLGV